MLNQIQSRDIKHLNTTLKVAKDVEGAGGAKVAAMLVVRNDIISFGYNRKDKTHPFQARFGKNHEAIYPHAETLCIYNAIKRHGVDILKRATLYVGRIKKDGSWGMAKPCSGCMGAIAQYGIKRVIYTTDVTGECVLMMVDRT